MFEQVLLIEDLTFPVIEDEKPASDQSTDQQQKPKGIEHPKIIQTAIPSSHQSQHSTSVHLESPALQ